MTDTFRAAHVNVTNLLTALSARRGFNLKVVGVADVCKCLGMVAVVRTKSAADTVELAGLPFDIPQWHAWQFLGNFREADPAQTVAQ